MYNYIFGFFFKKAFLYSACNLNILLFTMNSKKLILFFLLITIVNTSFSQLVNVEKRRHRANDTILGAVGVSASFLKNTKEVRKVNTSLALEWNKQRHTFLLYADLAYSNVDGSDILNSGYQHLRYNYNINKPDFITVEFFIQNQYDRIKLLEKRNLVGGGPRFRIFDKNKFYLYFSPLFMYEREVLSDGIGTETNLFKGDFYISTGLEFNEVFSVNHVIYYQPDMAKFNDFRLFSETAFAFKAFKRLTFSFNYQFSYDSHPPTDYTGDEPYTIPKLFYTLKNVITFKF